MYSYTVINFSLFPLTHVDTPTTTHTHMLTVHTHVVMGKKKAGTDIKKKANDPEVIEANTVKSCSSKDALTVARALDLAGTVEEDDLPTIARKSEKDLALQRRVLTGHVRNMWMGVNNESGVAIGRVVAFMLQAAFELVESAQQEQCEIDPEKIANKFLSEDHVSVLTATMSRLVSSFLEQDDAAGNTHIVEDYLPCPLAQEKIVTLVDDPLFIEFVHDLDKNDKRRSARVIARGQTHKEAVEDAEFAVSMGLQAGLTVDPKIVGPRGDAVTADTVCWKVDHLLRVVRILHATVIKLQSGTADASPELAGTKFKGSLHTKVATAFLQEAKSIAAVATRMTMADRLNKNNPEAYEDDDKRRRHENLIQLRNHFYVEGYITNDPHDSNVTNYS